MWSVKIEVRKPIDEAFQGGRLDTFGAADDAHHAAEVEPVEVAVGGLAGGQIEGEVGRRRAEHEDFRPALGSIWPAVPGTQPDSSGRRGGRSGSARRLPAPDPCRDRRATTTRSWRPSGVDLGVREKAAHQLLEIHLQVAVRDHDSGRKSGRTRAVLQIRGDRKVGLLETPGPRCHRRPDSSNRFRRSSEHASRCDLIDVVGDVVGGSRRGEDN